MTDTETDYMTPVEIAALKGVAYRTVLQAILAGKFKRVIKLGIGKNAHYAIHKGDVGSWTPRKYIRKLG